MRAFSNSDVEQRFKKWPAELRDRLMQLRELIFDVAENTNGVGHIEEVLKWDTPSYQTVRPKSGTPIRLGGNPEKGQYGLYVHCQTSLIERFRDIYPDVFTFEKNRAMLFDLNGDIAEEELRHCISMALTYHLK